LFGGGLGFSTWLVSQGVLCPGGEAGLRSVREKKREKKGEEMEGRQCKQETNTQGLMSE